MSEAQQHSSRVQTVVVTGAGGGVGYELVSQLAQLGVQVWALVHNKRDIPRFADFPTVTVLVQDLTDTQTLATQTARALKQASITRLDLLVHAAAVAPVGAASQAHTQVWRTTLDTNVIAPAVLTSSLIEHLRAAHGSIVFINSGAGERAVAQHAVYAASKHALRGYANTLRLEESQYGVRVSTVYPGQIATPMLAGIDGELGVQFDPQQCIQPQTVAKAIITIAQASDDVHITNVDLRPRQELTAAFNV